jgi:hypothetical protein
MTEPKLTDEDKRSMKALSDHELLRRLFEDYLSLREQVASLQESVEPKLTDADLGCAHGHIGACTACFEEATLRTLRAEHAEMRARLALYERAERELVLLRCAWPQASPNPVWWAGPWDLLESTSLHDNQEAALRALFAELDGKPNDD